MLLVGRLVLGFQALSLRVGYPLGAGRIRRTLAIMHTMSLHPCPMVAGHPRLHPVHAAGGRGAAGGAPHTLPFMAGRPRLHSVHAAGERGAARGALIPYPSWKDAHLFECAHGRRTRCCWRGARRWATTRYRWMWASRRRGRACPARWSTPPPSSPCPRAPPCA